MVHGMVDNALVVDLVEVEWVSLYPLLKVMVCGILCSILSLVVSQAEQVGHEIVFVGSSQLAFSSWQIVW